jgi:hypothetical protein
MRKPWQRHQPEEEPDEPEELFGLSDSQRRWFRIVNFFVVAPALGVLCTWWPWYVGMNQPAMQAQREAPGFYIAAFIGPPILWWCLVRLLLASQMLGDDELRTVEEDKRQEWLKQQYRKPSGVLDWGSFIFGPVHLVIVMAVA